MRRDMLLVQRGAPPSGKAHIFVEYVGKSHAGHGTTVCTQEHVWNGVVTAHWQPCACCGYWDHCPAGSPDVRENPSPAGHRDALGTGPTGSEPAARWRRRTVTERYRRSSHTYGDWRGAAAADVRVKTR